MRLYCLVARQALPRLVTVTCAGVLAGIVVWLPSQIEGWTYYRTNWEIIQSVADLLLIALALAVSLGVTLALLVTCLGFMLPLRIPSRSIAEWVRNGALAAVGVLTGSLLLRTIFIWFDAVGLVVVPPRWKFGLWVVLVLSIFALLFVFARIRQRSIALLRKSFDGTPTRRAVLFAGVAATATSVAGLTTRAIPAPKPARHRNRSAHSPPNILFLTFDALCAEDMSLYGYHLPTTPNIQRFAASASVFKNFYSCSTFTTPSITSLDTGRYPSSTGVYHLYGRLRGEETRRTLARTLQMAGYSTGASIANWAAHPHFTDMEGFDIAPAPPIDEILVRAIFDYAGKSFLAADLAPMRIMVLGKLERLLPAVFSPTRSSFPPLESFAQAKMIWKQLGGPKYLRVHVLAPHSPYQPTPPFRGRFLNGSEFLTLTELEDLASPLTLRYPPERQPRIDKARLRYNEWIAEADAAFGQFMASMEKGGELANTVVVISADHGESFQGGVYSHGGPTQLRPIIHVPLIVRTPGQISQRTFDQTADATSIAPTILDLAGVSIPDWIEGRSLGSALVGASDVRGYAFTQYLERNSVFRPIENGTVGVVDGRHQYVVDLSTGKGTLYELSEANLQEKDLSARQPDTARRLRHCIRAQFPRLSIPA